MRNRTELLAVVVLFFLALNVSGQTAGKDGNRVVGVIFKDEKTAFGDREEVASVLGYETRYLDSTNRDGVYCVTIPKEIKQFSLVFKAKGRWGSVTPTLTNDRDPIKIDRIVLEQMQPNNSEQLENIEALLEIEFAIYQTASAEAKQSIIKELSNFNSAIVVPPNPNLPEFSDPHERILRLIAKTRIETFLNKMK